MFTSLIASPLARLHVTTCLMRFTEDGVPFTETNWSDPIEWVILIVGALICISCLGCTYHALKRGKAWSQLQLTFLILLNFLVLLSRLIFRYVDTAPHWVDFFSDWSSPLLITLGLAVQFKLFSTILLLGDLDIRHLVPRLQMGWFAIYFLLMLPNYFTLGTLGKEPYPWIKGIREITRMIFGLICGVYDLVQGFASLILLARRRFKCRGKFNHQGRTFLDSLHECNNLILLNMAIFILIWIAISLNIYLIFYYSASLHVVLEESIAVLILLYYFQIIQVIHVAMKPVDTISINLTSPTLAKPINVSHSFGHDRTCEIKNDEIK